MKLIKLTQGKEAIVDDQDLEWLSKYKWYYETKGYAVTYERGKTHTTRKKLRMHSLILNTPEGYMSDHINRNRLDNRRSNLRIVTRSQNCRNTNLPKNNKSGHIGVRWYKAYSKWQADIRINGKRYFLGRYEKIEDAIKAYETVRAKRDIDLIS